MSDYHPALDAALHVVDQVLRSRQDLDGNTVRNMVRVEITAEVRDGLLEAHSHMFRNVGLSDPMQFAGIDFYTVGELPEPGWRVIDPFQRVPA